MPLPQEKTKFTYHDYLTWPDDERWEIIDGTAYAMSPAPNLEHQSIIWNLVLTLGAKLKGKTCVPWVAPTDVVLSESDIVQPDVFVVCDKNKMKGGNIQGAPDLIVEVLSPSTAKKDRWEKKNLYEHFGVKEYILIDPSALFAERYLLGTDGRFDRGEIFDSQQTMSLKSLGEMEISLWEIFEVKGPEKETDLR
ncbi:MAG: Uma2 family endonuclease [Candidatus Omnitrophota bacterium]